VTYLLSICAAMLYGAGDFIGGLATRRSNALAVVLVAQVAGVLPLVLVVWLLPPFVPTQADLLWGAGAGVAGGVGVLLLFHALAIGTMAVVAPITAVTAVVVPVAISVVMGERPGVQALAGIALAIASIALISRQRAEGADRGAGRKLPPGVGVALASGVALGFLLLMLGQTGSASGVWPVVSARAASVTLLSVVVIATRRSVRMPARVLALSIASGFMDVIANTLYVLAAQQGPLSIVVTLASLYPASTVLLARVVLRERLSGWQAGGVVLALAAVVLIVSGRG
jgi:drug/metabolite transporter (DMT)-like permease